ncbi:MAG TPA: hypothetical protein VFV37_08405 [Luteibaculaceae bacterium]|nr:hypothetical protein [Luteibaculaceae bacterium]
MKRACIIICLLGLAATAAAQAESWSFGVNPYALRSLNFPVGGRGYIPNGIEVGYSKDKLKAYAKGVFPSLVDRTEKGLSFSHGPYLEERESKFSSFAVGVDRTIITKGHFNMSTFLELEQVAVKLAIYDPGMRSFCVFSTLNFSPGVAMRLSVGQRFFVQTQTAVSLVPAKWTKGVVKGSGSESYAQGFDRNVKRVLFQPLQTVGLHFVFWRKN